MTISTLHRFICIFAIPSSHNRALPVLHPPPAAHCTSPCCPACCSSWVHSARCPSDRVIASHVRRSSCPPDGPAPPLSARSSSPCPASFDVGSRAGAGSSRPELGAAAGGATAAGAVLRSGSVSARREEPGSCWTPLGGPGLRSHCSVPAGPRRCAVAPTARSRAASRALRLICFRPARADQKTMSARPLADVELAFHVCSVAGAARLSAQTGAPRAEERGGRAARTSPRRRPRPGQAHPTSARPPAAATRRRPPGQKRRMFDVRCAR